MLSSTDKVKERFNMNYSIDIDPEMKALMEGRREKFLTSKFKRFLKINPRYQALKDKLMSIGGTAFIPMPDDNIEEILSRGQIFKDKKPIRWICKTAKEEQKHGLRCYSSDCHANISYDYVRFCGQGFKIVTGWALAYFDGDWRQHSWGIWKDHVVESTVLRRLYYGYMLTPEESVEFVFSNAPGIADGAEIERIKEATAFNNLVGKIVNKAKKNGLI
jgi:hypothetical protein